MHTQPQNVLYALFDDLRHDQFSFNAVGRQRNATSTPTFDRLAAESTYFALAFSQTAFCVPSRTSFLTGRRPETTGSVHNDQLMRFGVKRHMPLRQRTVFDAFKRAGYVTAATGKIFHFGENHPALDLPMAANTQDLLGRPCDANTASATDVRIPEYGKFGFATACELPFGSFVDERVVAQAVLYLRRFRKGQQAAAATTTADVANTTSAARPFLLLLGFQRPHNPYQIRTRFVDALPPANETDLAAVRHQHISQPAIAYADLMSRCESRCQREWRRYYRASVSFVDDLFGAVLRQLDALNLAASTLVVAHADHGFSLGENGAFQKRTNFDHSSRVPLFIRDPRLPRSRGVQVGDALVELVDVMPTLLDLSGAAAAAASFTGDAGTSELEGRSLRPLMIREAHTWPLHASPLPVPQRAIRHAKPAGHRAFLYAFMLQPRLLYVASGSEAQCKLYHARCGELIIDGGAALDAFTIHPGQRKLLEARAPRRVKQTKTKTTTVRQIGRPAPHESLSAAVSAKYNCSRALASRGFGPGRTCRFVAMGFSVRSQRWRYTRWENWPLPDDPQRVWSVGRGMLLAEELYNYTAEADQGAPSSVCEEINLANDAHDQTPARAAALREVKTELMRALLSRSRG